jgi:hypothetical protein
MSANFSPLRSVHGFKSPGFLVSPTGELTIDGEVTINNVINVDQVYIRGFSLLDVTDSTVSLDDNIRNSSLTGLGVLERLEVDGDVFIGIASTNFITINDGIISITSTNTGAIENMEIGAVTPADANFRDVTVGQTGANVVTSVALGNAGSNYTSGTKTTTGQIGTSGTGLTVAITVTTGAVQTVTIVNGGIGYVVGDIVDIDGGDGATLEITQAANNAVLTVNGTVDVTVSATITTVNSTTGNITTVNSTTGNITTINATEVDVDDITINNLPVEIYHATRKDYVDNRITAFAIGFGA